MPVYNAERYVSEAINSVLAQTFTDFEFIIIDDGSTDASADIITQYKDQRIRFIRKPRNEGLVSALNLGIELALGEYIARMDADDIALPERLEKQVAFLDSHPDVVVLGTKAWRIDPAGKIIESMVSVTRWEDVHRYLRSGANRLIHSSVMMRTEIVRKIGGYREQFRHAEDFDLWLRILEHGKICNLPEKLMLYRSNSSGVRLTKILEAAHSAAYAIDCYLRRNNGLKERPRNEFVINNRFYQREVDSMCIAALLECIMIGELNKAREILRIRVNNSKTFLDNLLDLILSCEIAKFISLIYKKYRRVRSIIIDSKYSVVFSDIRHINKFLDDLRFLWL
jgi:glycosyltransferase involved in cell wall biosynthesis